MYAGVFKNDFIQKEELIRDKCLYSAECRGPESHRERLRAAE
jgi:hypothetical protein